MDRAGLKQVEKFVWDVYTCLERFWWSTTEIGHTTICIGEGLAMGAFQVQDS